jgi:hypothetical protein
VFLLYALAVGLVLGLLLGGRLSRLGDIRLRWPAVALAGLIVQIVLFAPGVGDRLGALAPLVYIGSTFAVLLFVLRNVRVTGFPIIALGAACNLAAIVANGGYMPASPAALRALGEPSAPAGYSNSREIADPLLVPLTDIFALPAWMPFANIFSIGDVLIGLGVAIAIMAAMSPGRLPQLRLPGVVRGGNSVD